MTSRFGKTYSRKGGDGSSKFDEIFSNKKATLSTKWGETTATVGSKRPGFRPEVSELPKKPHRMDEDSSEDPFGFDSDDDSKPVTSRNIGQTRAPLAEPSCAERPRTPLGPNSRLAQSASIEAAPPSRDGAILDGDKDTSNRAFNSNTGKCS